MKLPAFLLTRRTLALTGASLLSLSQNSLAMATSPPKRSFYRRPLPSTCTALSSTEGRSFFESALCHKGLKSFFPLMEQFTTQSEPAYCGISTLVMVLNALAVDPRRTWKGPWRWYEESMLNCCVDLEEVKTTGISIKTFACLAQCQGLNVASHLASNVTIDDFREAVRLACTETNGSDDATPFLVISYDRKAVKQTGSGHFSPVAAYDEASDHVLILDTARFKYGAHWISLSLVFQAMQPIDPDTGNSRGYILLSFKDQDKESSVMPLSILFRTTHSHFAARQEYKEFLSRLEKKIKWEQVLSYWTRDGKDPKYIWQMTETQLTPMDDTDRKAVAAVLDLIASLLPDTPDNLDSEICCRSNMSRKLCLSPKDVMFVVYLASLDLEDRREIVDKSYAPTTTRQQLLTEAELLRLAIDMSDEIEMNE